MRSQSHSKSYGFFVGIGRCSVDTPLRRAHSSPFIPPSLPAFLSLSLPPFPLSFLSFLENLLCSRHCVKHCASEGALGETVSVFKEGLVWWRGKHSTPRPLSSPPSVCFSTVWFCYWRFIGAQPCPFACTLSAAAPALQRQP